MIVVSHCSKSFPSRDGARAVPVLDDVSLTVADGEFVCLLGPSGCGKTTLLRIMAGLVRPDAGHIEIGGEPVRGPGPDRALVFQDFALLPWADVVTNVAFGLELRGVSVDERQRRAMQLIAEVGLRGFEHHLPRQLSGGMQQRVGLARALAVSPSILLMDEPFGSLDAQTRRGLQVDLERLHGENRQTVLFVTHSVDEAVRLADRIVLFSPRPARVLEIIPTGLPRPRPSHLDAYLPFVEMKDRLWSRLRARPDDPLRDA